MRQNIFYVALMMLALSACESVDSEMDSYDDGGIGATASNAISVISELQGLTRGTPIYDVSDIENMGVMGLYADYSTSESTVFTVFNNQKMEQKDDLWSYSPIAYWYDNWLINSVGSYKFVAYAPYIENTDNYNDSGLKITGTDKDSPFYSAIIHYSQSGVDIANQPDLMVAVYAPTDNKKSDLSFNFAHALAAISFKGFGLGQKVTEIKFSNIINYGWLQLFKIEENGIVWSVDDPTSTISISSEDGFIINKDGELMINDNGTLMMLPQELTDGATLTLTVNGTERVIDISDDVWVAGKDIVYNLSVGMRFEDFTDIEVDTNYNAIMPEWLWLPNYSGVEYGTSPTSSDMPREWIITNSDSDSSELSLGREFIDLYAALLTAEELLDGDLITLKIDNMEDLSTSGGAAYSFDDEDGATIELTTLGEVSLAATTQLDDATFQYASNLTTVNAPNLTDITNFQFRNCTLLSDVNFGNESASSDNTIKLTSVGTFAFYNCPALGRNVEMHDADSIGDHAFYNTSIKSIKDVDNKVLKICDNAFYQCKSMTVAEFPAVEIIQDYAFIECSSLLEFSAPNATTMERYVFQDCSSLMSVYLPNVEAIGEHTFNDCVALQSATITSATSIGDYAFKTCSVLKDINFSKLESIGKYAFMDCYNLYPAEHDEPCTHSAGTIHATELESISEGAFQRCYSLEQAIMPKVTKIGAQAFYMTSDGSSVNYTSQLTSVELSSDLETIGDRAFSDCVNLKYIFIDDEDDAATEPVEDASYDFEKVSSIGESAFSNCSSLLQFSAPNVESVGSNAFSGCESITSFSADILTDSTSVGNIIRGLTNVKILKLAAATEFPSVWSVGGEALSELIEVDLPSLTSINQSNFDNSTLIEYMNLPNVSEVSAYALQSPFSSTDNVCTLILGTSSDKLYFELFIGTYTDPNTLEVSNIYKQPFDSDSTEKIDLEIGIHSSDNCNYTIVDNTLTIYGYTIDEDGNYTIDYVTESNSKTYTFKSINE